MPLGPYRLLAHRGDSLRAPENTLEAVRHCRAEQADAIEVDVRLTADLEPVLFHDEDARRLTGAPGRVRELRWSRLRALRVHGKHAIPHFEDALRELESWPGAELYVDLHEPRLDLAEAVASRLAKSSVLARSYVLAFYWDRGVLEHARRVCPDVRLAVMPGPPWNIEASWKLGAKALCMGWDGPRNRLLYRAASKLFDVRARLAPVLCEGVRVSAGVANTAEDLRWLVEQGFTEFWTDDLGLARRTLTG
ncbi:MAG: glycerophosphodiester phosphodiesterase family protein [Elusimicrobia bacterium]|nr:glycerophosphodiester phosphodiesterase family protein [Elusimicrobiota bacterium]